MHRFDLGVLLEMLTYARPSGSQTERDFIARYVATLPNATQDPYGNWHVVIGESPILWSCHTDTVHHYDGRQTVHHDPLTGRIALARRSKRGRNGASCLGADDTAGVFLCWSMIGANVPGHYVFHHAEEVGGIGSSDLAADNPALIAASRFAIALDRQGFGDVITRQSAARCCSDAFAQSLADQLNASGLEFSPSDHGVFTDTANYTDIIGECTNLSVGYFDAHTRQESLNAHFLARLLTALCSIDPAGLVDARQPGETDPADRGFNAFRFSWETCKQRPLTPLFKDVCEYCGSVFDPEESYADENRLFCSTDCEGLDLEETVRRMEQRRHDPRETLDSTYIDPVFAEVARCLRAMQGENGDEN